MNEVIKKLTSGLAMGLVLAAVMATTGYAQIPGNNNTAAVVNEPAAAGRMDPATIRIHRRARVTFKPFTMRDRQTGQDVAPDREFTLGNGKKVTARQYLAEINKLEKQLNTVGRSLRESGTEIDLQENIVDDATLQRQTNKLRVATLPNTRSQPFSLQLAEREHINLPALPVNDSPKMKMMLLAPPKKYNYGWGWSWGVGNPKTFAVNVATKLAVAGVKQGSAMTTDVTAEGKAGGSMFNHGFSILSAKANLHAANSGAMNAKVSMSVMGNTIFNLDKYTTAKYYKSDSLSKGIEKHVTIPFTLVVIPCSVKLGIQGTTGLGYAVSIAPVAAKVSWGPYVNSKAYAQAGVDLIILGAGVGGDLTLLNYGVTLTGQASFGIDASNKPFFYTEAGVSHHLNMLSGSLYAYLEVCVPCDDFESSCGFPVFSCPKKLKHTFFKWKGFEIDGALLNFKKKHYI